MLRAAFSRFDAYNDQNGKHDALCVIVAGLGTQADGMGWYDVLANLATWCTALFTEVHLDRTCNMN